MPNDVNLQVPVGEAWLETRRSRVHFLSAGESGPSVVLLHGGAVDAASLSWKYTLPRLARSHQVKAPDWPGYGESAPLAGAYTTEALIDCLDEMLAGWRIDRATLVGVSMGGGVALGFALRHPERVRRLVLVDSFGLSPRVPFHSGAYLLKQFPFVVRWAVALARQNRTVTRWGLRHLVRRRSGIEPELVSDVHEALQNRGAVESFIAWQTIELQWRGFETCYRERLQELRLPVLLVHGRRDHLVPVAASVAAQRRIPGARLCVIEGCGHWPPRDDPEAFQAALEAFLEDSALP